MARRDSPNSSNSAGSQSATSITSGDSEIDWPFGARLDSLRRSEIRETAYEIFFMCCRFSPGFGSKGAIAYVASGGDVVEAPSSTPSRAVIGPRGGTGMMAVNSRVKSTLGLRAARPPPMRTMNSKGLTSVVVGSPSTFIPNSPGRNNIPNSPAKIKRPMTSAEIMLRQMRITVQSDSRLKKILLRSFLGQNGRRAENFILPLELLRHLKPSEFSDNQEYHQWQRRQLKILEVGLLIHPSLPLDRLNAAALQFREVLLQSEMKPIDTGKNSDVMQRLSNSVMALAWRNSTMSNTGACHWADGFPVNVHLYLALLKAIFDMREENVVLDEVDELLELMKKTWPTLGINRMIHNVCFTWVLFQQYVTTGQVEPDLIKATLNMLLEVENDAKRTMEREHNYVKVLAGVITSMQGWAEKRLLDYHENFNKGTVGNMGNILSLALATTKIIIENIPGMAGNTPGLSERDAADGSHLANRVEFYIQRSMRNAFTKVFETGPGHIDSMIVEVDEDPSDILIQLAKDVEALAAVERENFSPVLRHWCPAALGVALLTLHNCFGVILKQYLAKVSSLSGNLVSVLHCAGKLEKLLMQMAADDSADYDDGSRSVLRDMIPYEVDTIGAGLLKTWVDERLGVGREYVSRAKETENWMPKSKSKPFTQSVIDLIKLATVTVDEFFQIPMTSAREEMVHDLAEGLESIFQDYTNFVASCGTRQSYLPLLPPLTRCNQDSRFTKLWNKAKPCTSGTDTQQVAVGGGGPVASTPAGDTRHPRPSTSRGTQRLYIRINTLHYLHSHIHLIDKSLSFFSRGGASAHPGPSPTLRYHHHQQQLHANRRLTPAAHFDLIRASIQVAIQRVSEVAAYRLIFLDSGNSFYSGLYTDDVAGCRIDNALRVLKQNLKLLLSVLTDRAQPPAMKEVMRATFQAFLMVLLAGGPDRAFLRTDYEIVIEDFQHLKKTFCASDEGLVPEDVVDREAEVVEGIVRLMSLPTERLIEDFTIAACESSSAAEGQRLLMPPTTGNWSRSDPNTVLRVICHRNDDMANNFLKKAFQLPKRR